MLTLLLLSSAARATTLDEAWKAAEQKSVALGILHERTVQTETLRGQALALVQPKLVLGATYTINEYAIELDPSEFFDPSQLPDGFQSFFDDYDPEPIVISPKQYLAWNASIVQPLFNGQAIPAVIGASDTIKAGREDEAAARANVHAGLARAYYGVAVARAGEEVARQALANAESHQKLADAQVAAGTSPPNTALQAKIAVARAQREVAKAEEGRSAAEQALSKLTDLPLDTPVEMPDPPAIPYATVDDAVRHAADNDPAIVSAAYQAHAARMQKLATRLGWLPSLDGRFTYSYSENTGFSDDPTMWQLVFTANWTLWDGGYRLAEGRRTASVARMAQLASDMATQDADEKIHAAWEKHARAEVSLAAVQGEVDLATENLRLAEAAFAAGTIPFIQLEDARLGLAAARVASLNERMDRDCAAIELLVATGELRP